MIFTFVLVTITLKQTVRDNGLTILWYVNGGVTLVVDLTIWGVPIPIIVRSGKLDWNKKVRLFLAFGVGLLSCASTLARLCLIPVSKIGEDTAYNRVYIHVLCTSEMGFGICAASMMPLRPILTKMNKWFRGTRTSAVTNLQNREPPRRINLYPGLDSRGDGNNTTSTGICSDLNTGNNMASVVATSDFPECGNDLINNTVSAVEPGNMGAVSVELGLGRR